MQNGLVMTWLAAMLCGAATSTHATGSWRASSSNTRGWQLMSPEERIDHQAKVRGFTDYGACEAYRASHHDMLAARARQRGLPPPGDGPDFCAHLKPRTAPD